MFSYISEIGVKHDKEKAKWALMPFDEVEDILKVLEFGAKKYAPDNWKNIQPERYFEALLRHLFEWKKNFDKGTFNVKDNESGLSTLSHVGCCALFLIWHAKKMEEEEKKYV